MVPKADLASVPILSTLSPPSFFVVTFWFYSHTPTYKYMYICTPIFN